MIFSLIISDEAKNHLEKHRKSGSIILLRKIDKILNELRDNPFEGTGKPEKLKYENAGKWSRRIDKKHRLIYEIIENEILVEVISAFGHYDDK